MEIQYTAIINFIEMIVKLRFIETLQIDVSHKRASQFTGTRGPLLLLLYSTNHYAISSFSKYPKTRY